MKQAKVVEKHKPDLRKPKDDHKIFKTKIVKEVENDDLTKNVKIVKRVENDDFDKRSTKMDQNVKTQGYESDEGSGSKS